MFVNLSFMAVLTSDLSTSLPIRLSGYLKCCMQFVCRNGPPFLYTAEKFIWFS